MVNFNSVLVPLDGSIFAEHALPLAVAVAHKTGASLRLLRLIPPLEDGLFWAPLPGTAIETDLRQQKRTDVQAYLDDVGKRLKDILACPVICEVMDERDVGISESICADAAKTGADLIVLSSHGRGAMGRFWMGSIADELVRTAPIPVLLARPAEPAPAPDFHHPVVVKHIIIALGGETAVERIVEPALAVGNVTGAEYTLVRAIRSSLGRMAPHGDEIASLQPAMELVGSEEIDNQMRRDAEEYLGAVAGRLRAGGAKVQTSVPIAEDPAAAILREAARVGADLIAMETHGRGISRVLVESVADMVVRGSHLPVLVCRFPRGES